MDIEDSQRRILELLHAIRAQVDAMRDDFAAARTHRTPLEHPAGAGSGTPGDSVEHRRLAQHRLRLS